MERGREQPPIPSGYERPAQPEPEDAPLIALAEALVRTRALENDLAYELMAARADLQRIVLAVRDDQPLPDVRTLQGWRRDLIGEELIALLRGDLALAMGPARRIEVLPRQPPA